jgi:hypothetical protein
MKDTEGDVIFFSLLGGTVLFKSRGDDIEEFICITPVFEVYA